jgi:hypothetical protein
VSEFPQEARFFVQLTIEAGGVPAGEYTIHVGVMAPGGAKLTRESIPITVTEQGAIPRIQRLVAVVARLEQPGIHTIAVCSESAALAILPINVDLQNCAATSVEPLSEQK